MASSRETTCAARSAVDITSGYISTTTHTHQPRRRWTEPWPPGDDPGRRSGTGLELRVLGPVEILRGGVPEALPGRTTTIILAALALSPNRIVPNDTLIDWIWGARAPARPRGALQSGVSRLRRLVGEDLVETAGFGYRLRATADQLDLVGFDELADLASRVSGDGGPERALTSLDRALRLWRGFPLSNVNSPALRRDMLPGLTERYLRAVELRSGLCLRLGRYPSHGSGAVGRRAAVPVSRAPDRAAHDRAGEERRRADALAAYDRLRRSLADDLGIDPSEALQALQGRILRADEGWVVRDWANQPDWLRQF